MKRQFGITMRVTDPGAIKIAHQRIEANMKEVADKHLTEPVDVEYFNVPAPENNFGPHSRTRIVGVKFFLDITE